MSSSKSDQMFWAVVGVLAVSAVVQIVNREEESEFNLVPLEIGDTLPPITLNVILAGDAAPGSGDKVSVRDVFDGHCGLMVFFHSECAGVKTVAPDWSGVDTVMADGVKLPVAWVTLGDDSLVSDFVAEHNLPTPVYSVRSLSDLGKLGVNLWPTVYSLSEEGVILDRTAWSPSSVKGFANYCGRRLRRQ